ncbi:hypothetical protein GQ53DRAFT_820739 [Thozetella sp. PMI_491]|nr:hypothetical protein GQ53DRAFT_820739 [Thozetella sp. PMI_491]
MAATKKDVTKKEAGADFQKIILEGRDRKKNEALAARIFNKDRRSSAPIKPTAGGTLASRAGVKKRVASSTVKPTGNIDGEWTHDLHEANSAPSTPLGGRGPKPKANSLAARVTAPGANLTNARQKRRAAQVAQALIKTELGTKGQSSNASNGTATGVFNKGISIRGLAGPFVVMAQNFAPGTTAADIESAMTPVGGLINSCRLLKTSPIVIAEIVFESKEGADNVIARFNNQTADGRVLHVYPKVGGGAAPTAPSAPRRERNDGVVDGTLGFDDPMDTSSSTANTRSNGDGGLYSDRMVQSNRRGRGAGRGAGRGRR